MCMPAIPASSRIGLVPPPPDLSDLRYVVGIAGEMPTMINAAGTNQGADAPLPKLKAAAPAGGRR